LISAVFGWNGLWPVNKCETANTTVLAVPFWGNTKILKN